MKETGEVDWNAQQVQDLACIGPQVQHFEVISESDWFIREDSVKIIKSIDFIDYWPQISKTFSYFDQYASDFLKK
ncbi:hypothetical protein BWI97_24505 [Siphonobacter sp. BAB-5405]|nr:hypothetical protein BWI97_24505 [Siphonobacter sp. BAB-5405]